MLFPLKNNKMMIKLNALSQISLQGPKVAVKSIVNIESMPKTLLSPSKQQQQQQGGGGGGGGGVSTFLLQLL